MHVLFPTYQIYGEKFWNTLELSTFSTAQTLKSQLLLITLFNHSTLFINASDGWFWNRLISEWASWYALWKYAGNGAPVGSGLIHIPWSGASNSITLGSSPGNVRFVFLHVPKSSLTSGIVLWKKSLYVTKPKYWCLGPMCWKLYLRVASFVLKSGGWGCYKSP